MLSCEPIRFKRMAHLADISAKWGQRAATSVLDFCYPRRCAACDLHFEPATLGSAVVLCGECDAQLEQIAFAPSCARCAMPAVVAGAPCPHCLGKGLRPFERVASVGVFNDPLKKLVHRMKYSRRWALAGELVDRAMQRGDVRNLLESVQVVVPVPLHRWRQVGRGYNQAEVVARRLARAAGKRVELVAIRAKATAAQAHVRSREQRFENVRDAFVLERPAAIAGKRVLVVDDVMTSGATMVAMGRTLLAAKPAGLCGFVVAVADPKGRAFEVV